MSDWLKLLVAMAAATAVVVLIAVIRDRRRPEDEDPDETPDVIEYMTMMVGVVYAIVLGLAIAGVWESRGEAQQTVQREAFALHEVSERAAAYPAGQRDAVRASVDAYVAYAVKKEWDPAIAEGGGLTPRGDRLMEDVRKQVSAYEPKTESQNRAAYALGDQAAQAAQARQERGLGTDPTMPPVVWVGLIIGAIVSIGMVFALQIQRSARELVLAGLFSALMAFLLFLVWAWNHPYGGTSDAGTMTEPFTTLFPGSG
ncbi:hypothetical protein [Streptomyces boninensis]|uniref:bestrophin-like domain n=1 Tax=Streptomyces boninensis TaxID=2039455 RepID=UPI003B217744